ncbi:MAG: undecaprenyl/decaprenyl-phosphate alpha-N-acetylglucosaminyl 1-phosphate transferase [Firmicutes bacterium]|nr:undecaprenyl/decaprenyl-phosphate alpha-N-acetylglucosaminyl 1-phosphate transferase [Bacillota bacterium]
MNQDILIRIFWIVMVPFLFVALIIPFIKKIALHVDAVDIPDKRKVHVKPMPRLGGLGIYGGFLLGYMLFGQHSATMNSILIGSFIIVLTGVVDDIKPLKASTKFIGQIIAALVVVFYGNIVLKDVSAFGIYINFSILSYPLTVLFIVGCINCMNLIDGLDGLSSGISSIYFLTIGIIATIKGSVGLDFVLTFVMLGSSLGFLVHNFYPATIFMGDSGSMFLGFIIAVIALLGFKNVTMTSLIIPLLILSIPILDTLFAIIRRLLKGESISTPDKFHIHHQFLNRNFSQRTTVLIIYLINLLFSFASIVYVLKNRSLGYIIYGVLLFIVIIFVIKTNIIFDHETLSKKKKAIKK